MFVSEFTLALCCMVIFTMSMTGMISEMAKMEARVTKDGYDDDDDDDDNDGD